MRSPTKRDHSHLFSKRNAPYLQHAFTVVEILAGMCRLYIDSLVHRLALPETVKAAFITKPIVYMKKNMGSTDRVIRVVLAIVFAVLYFTQTVTGTAGLVMLVLGGIFLATSLISFCPLYTLFGINTCSVREK